MSWNGVGTKGRKIAATERVFKIFKTYLSSNNGVHQMSIAVVLVLQNVVEDLEEQGQVTVSVFAGIQEFGTAEQFKQVDKLDRGHQTHASPVGTDIAHNGQETRVKRDQLVGTVDNELVKCDCQKIRMAPRKEWEVGRKFLLEGFVERNAKAAFSAELQQNKGANVDQSNLSGVSAALVHEEADGNNQLVHIALGQDVVHEQGILFQEFPQQH